MNLDKIIEVNYFNYFLFLYIKNNIILFYFFKFKLNF